MRLFQYQRLAAPVEPPAGQIEEITLDKWWQPASQPDRLTRVRRAALLCAAPFFFAAPEPPPPPATLPLYGAVSQPIGTIKGRIAQTLAFVKIEEAVPAPDGLQYVEPNQPPRALRAKPHLYPYFSLAFFESVDGAPVFGGLPIPAKPGLHPSRLPAMVAPVEPVADVPAAPDLPLGQAQVPARRTPARTYQAYFAPETVLRPDILQDISQPVRSKARRPAGGEVAPLEPTLFVTPPWFPETQDPGPPKRRPTFAAWSPYFVAPVEPVGAPPAAPDISYPEQNQPPRGLQRAPHLWPYFFPATEPVQPIAAPDIRHAMPETPQRHLRPTAHLAQALFFVEAPAAAPVVPDQPPQAPQDAIRRPAPRHYLVGGFFWHTDTPPPPAPPPDISYPLTNQPPNSRRRTPWLQPYLFFWNPELSSPPVPPQNLSGNPIALALKQEIRAEVPETTSAPAVQIETEQRIDAETPEVIMTSREA